MPRVRRAPQQLSATDPEFEQHLREGITGLNNGTYSTQMEAVRALKVHKLKCICGHER